MSREVIRTETIKILLVEDHAVVRQGTHQLLEREEDFEVVGEASNGEEAIQLASQLQPDVIIMDISMPKVNGLEATKQIKAFLPSVAVLILTAYDYDEYIFTLLEVGAAGYLLKSVSGDELVEAVRAVKAGEPVLHPVAIRRLMSQFQRPNAHQAISPSLELLTEREVEVLKLAAKGTSNKEIGDKLCISTRTVQAHLRNIFRKLSVGSRSELILHGLKRGWFTLEELS